MMSCCLLFTLHRCHARLACRLTDLTFLFLFSAQIAGEGGPEARRLRLPAVVRLLPGALQDAVARHLAAVGRRRDRRCRPAPQRPAHLGHRVRLRPAQALHQEQLDGISITCQVSYFILYELRG